jgi:hypothetical protein
MASHEILLYLGETIFCLSIRETEERAGIRFTEDVRRAIRVAVNCDCACKRVGHIIVNCRFSSTDVVEGKSGNEK